MSERHGPAPNWFRARIDEGLSRMITAGLKYATPDILEETVDVWVNAIWHSGVTFPDAPESVTRIRLAFDGLLAQTAEWPTVVDFLEVYRALVSREPPPERLALPAPECTPEETEAAKNGFFETMRNTASRLKADRQTHAIHAALRGIETATRERNPEG